MYTYVEMVYGLCGICLSLSLSLDASRFGGSKHLLGRYFEPSGLWFMEASSYHQSVCTA